MQTEKRGRGRPPARNPREHKVEVYLTAEQWDELERLRGSEDRSGFCRRLFLDGLHSDLTRWRADHDSGQAARDEAAEIEDEMTAFHAEVARVQRKDGA